MSGSSDDLDNLRLLCPPCHHDVTNAHLVPIAETDTETIALANEIHLRVVSPVPIKECDTPAWSERDAWRRWVREHERTP